MTRTFGVSGTEMPVPSIIALNRPQAFGLAGTVLQTVSS